LSSFLDPGGAFALRARALSFFAPFTTCLAFDLNQQAQEYSFVVSALNDPSSSKRWSEMENVLFDYLPPLPPMSKPQSITAQQQKQQQRVMATTGARGANAVAAASAPQVVAPSSKNEGVDLLGF
jgi:hypothetical protein